MPQGKRQKRLWKPAEKVLVVVAFITVVGGIVTAFISNIDKWRPNQNNISTNIMPVGNVNAPPSPTPTPTAGGLAGQIEAVEVIPNPGGGAQVFIRLSVSNNTNDPTIVHKYAVKIDHVTSKSFQYTGPTHDMEKPYKLPQAGVVEPQESMVTKTRKAIPKDEKVSGWLRVLLPNPFLEPDIVRQVGTRYNVSFADAAGTTYQVGHQIR